MVGKGAENVTDIIGVAGEGGRVQCVSGILYLPGEAVNFMSLGVDAAVKLGHELA